MNFLNELNDRQREAAETLAGPLLIIAGAGSGKTRALTYRIANIIAQGMAQPWQILAVTFTNKAAGEMQSRVENLLSENFDLNEKNRPLIGTFHSVCVRILRKHFDRFGREKSFVIYDATGNIVKQIPYASYAAGKHGIYLESKELRPGMYLLRVTFNGKDAYTVKLLKGG